MQNDNLITIRKAAEMLGVSVDTLRRWDRSGVFPAIKSPGGHRYYAVEQINLYKRDLFSIAKKWVIAKNGDEPEGEFYSPNSAAFQAKLVRMEKELMETYKNAEWMSLVVAATGEIGSNSFDHNLGNWRDVPGVFYGYDVHKRLIVLADRGQGVLATLRRVKPMLSTDAAALRTAFTEVISGRAPEARGNGLKLVKLIVEKHPISLTFSSGNAIAILAHGKSMKISAAPVYVSGCIAYLQF